MLAKVILLKMSFSVCMVAVCVLHTCQGHGTYGAGGEAVVRTRLVALVRVLFLFAPHHPSNPEFQGQ